MIIKATNAFSGTLDLSALERLQESNPCEKYPFRLYIKPGQTVEADDKFYTLTSIQNAIRLGYIQIGGLSNLNTSLIDLSYSGTTVGQIAGENLVTGDAVYYKDDGKVYRAKADSTTTMICIGIVVSDSSVNESVLLLVEGMIRNSSRFSFTIGGQASKANDRSIVYVNEVTSGAVTQLRSTTTGHIVQIVGYALTNDILSFRPDYTYIEIN